jgi:hypothetical protein
VIIRDHHFVLALYLRFCQRIVAGAMSRAFLRSLRMRVTEGEGLDSLRVEVVAPEGTLITLGVSTVRGATVLGYYPEDQALAACNEDDALHSGLSDLLYDFLQRHGVLVPVPGRRDLLQLARVARRRRIA